MPKSRNNSIGNRSINGASSDTVGDAEMSERIENRLRNAGTVRVEVESRTRGVIESIDVLFQGSTAAVASESGRTYIVDLIENTCSCPDYIHRENRCRHLEAVDLAREQTITGTSIGSADDINLSTAEVLSEYARHERLDEISNHQNEYFDDNFFYSENPEVFSSDFNRLIDAEVPYYYENVLNGANGTFGIELEFVSGDSNAIAAELHALGICDTPRMERYHSNRTPGKWCLEADSSVTSVGGRGGEIISPILTDTPTTWRQIEIICEVARRHGARVSSRTGGHVHIGADRALDGKRQRWRRFFKATVGFESVFHRLAGGEQGIFRGGMYAPSSEHQNRTGIVRRMPEEGELHVFQDIIRNISHGKYQSINIQPFSSKKTIEFRAFNGTLTPGIIQANIKYAAGIINAAERSRTKSGEGGLLVTESDTKRGRIINDYDNNNVADNRAIMKALDAVFSRKEDKEHILSVIAKNEWSNQ